MNEQVLIVNEHNTPIGHATKSEIWSKGLWHRVVRVIITTPNGCFLSQHRSKDMELYPDHWTDTASGHVDEGESDAAAARRELLEETGLDIPLHYSETFSFKDVFEDKKVNNFNVIYKGTVEDEVIPGLHTEVQGFQWFTPWQLRWAVEKEAIMVTPTLLTILKRYE